MSTCNAFIEHLGNKLESIIIFNHCQEQLSMKLGSKYDLLDTPCVLKFKQIYGSEYLQIVEKIQ